MNAPDRSSWMSTVRSEESRSDANNGCGSSRPIAASIPACSRLAANTSARHASATWSAFDEEALEEVMSGKLVLRTRVIERNLTRTGHH
jgi:hypothetical protein